ncbi:MAG TPA: adenosylcobinamide-GDP ribazoletransferase, partial [Alphaproteobacteria bacterium]|nr:adenosylcobinamide-GDP ribazoletransferase [Alphaproteobacteria bacterium]
SGMLSRAAIVGVMFALPPAQDNGLSAEAGRPSQIVLIVAVLSAIGGTFLLLPPLSAALCCAGAALAATVMGALSQRHLGGQTGDILGATQQVCELVILLTLLTQAAR